MAAATGASADLARANAGARTRRLFLRFDIAGDRYVLAASRIVRMLPWMPLKGLPAAPDWAAGVLLYGDTPVPVIDISALATGRRSAARASTRIAVVEYRAAMSMSPSERDAAAPARLLGLLLEHATQTVHYDDNEFVPCGLDNPAARYLGPVRADDQGLVQQVGVDDLLPAQVRERLFQEVLESAS
ncbi:CheW-like domain-containing protein [Bordetella sputigena]|uniref:chemotaxis protein CheW n=1 Tax=Bordetella sputigena TaxID=1416810 RepID=UPI0039F13E9A